MARRYRFEQTQIVPRRRAEVFAFFSEAQNLERLTPSFLGFEILTPGIIEMKSGTIIDYKLRLYGISVKWKTRIEEFVPESHFVDIQLKGPYRYWHHLHEFEEVSQGTRMRDLVHYELPFGPLGILARTLFVQQSLKKIFGFRRQVIGEVFGTVAS